MPSRLASVSAAPHLRQFAQGAAQDMTQPVADFLAPTVEVPTSVGRYKVYTEKHRFRIPDTRRAIGGRATELAFSADDATYNCEPHALDFPIDNLEELESAQLESAFREGAQATAEVAALSHEKKVIDLALSTLGAGTDVDMSDVTVDPVNVFDTYILSVLKAAKYGSAMGARILFGANAARKVKNHPLVRARFPGRQSVAPSLQDIVGLFLGNPEQRVTYMVYDAAAEGAAESIDFVLDNSVIIFAAKANPTRRDPSFMKTFRLMGQWMVPGSYTRDDGRVEVAKFDWSEDTKVTNSAAAVRLNLENEPAANMPVTLVQEEE